MRFFLTLVAVFFATLAHAQDRSRAILVMDGSGSMWGQIDGVAKITIAQGVVGDLLGELPVEQELGLTVYGHRRKGDCSDIETVVTPGADTRDAIGQAVDGISPKGKTPMTDAVIAAAEALRYTEERATVILVSDGIETCAPDPCAAARTLEESGVDFTAHVIGFDVADDPDAVAQMQCIADETGGTFRTASNAAELGEALAVVADPEPEPEYTVELIATDGDGGPRILEGLVWDIGETADGPWLVEGDKTAVHVIDQLPEGTLFARVLRSEDGATAEETFAIDATTPDVLTLVLPELPPSPVRLTARAVEEGTGAVLSEGLVWSLTDAEGTAIVDNTMVREIAEELLPGTYDIVVLRVEDEAFAEKTVVIDKDSDQVLVRLELPEILRPAKLSFEARIENSGRIIQRELQWTVTDRDGMPVFESIGSSDSTELIPGRYTVAAMRPEDGMERQQEIALTKNGKNVRLDFPPYEAAATLDAKGEAPAGSVVLVDWTGPNEKNDYIAIAKPDDKDNRYSSYAYTRNGPTLELNMPSAPGDYEVRYFMAKEGRVVARRPLTATPVTATLSAPDEAPSGATVPVEWTGPGYQNDYVDVAEVGAKNNKYVNYKYTRNGSPAEVTMPIEPGTYELRYIMAQDRVVLATRQIEVTAETFEVSGPAEAIAGSTIAIDWVGPDLSNDFISVAEAGSKPGKYEGYAYTRNGSPAEVTLPMEPGNYEIRYIVAQGKEDMASYDLTILPVTGTITAASTVPAGGLLEVTWDGPGYQNDYVAFAEVGSKVGKYLGYQYTRSGKTLEVQAPPYPGEYELRYIARSNKMKLLASQTVTVTPVTATLTAPDTAAAGSRIDVTWDGPGYQRDYVAIFPEGEEQRYLVYQYTRAGDVLELNVPDEAGRYEVRYILGEGKVPLVSVPLVVE